MRRMRSLGGSWVLDRTWYEDAEVFARGLYEQRYMTEAEWDLYARLYGELLHAPAARPPRLLIYLHGPLTTILDRIAERGRPKERETRTDYWIALHTRYADWIARFHRCPVLSLDVRDYDIIGDAVVDRGHRDACAREPRGRNPAAGAERVTCWPPPAYAASLSGGQIVMRLS